MGGSLPRHAAELSVIFMKGLKDMMVIPRRGENGRPAHYRLTELARNAGIGAHHAILLATSLAVAHGPSLTRAVRFADEHGLGGEMIAACVFGTFTDSFALCGRLTSRIVGNPTAYRAVGPALLARFLGVIHGTCRSNTRMKGLYRTGKFDMYIKVVNSALTLGAAGAVVRGASPWLRLPPMPRELLDVKFRYSPLGLTKASFLSPRSTFKRSRRESRDGRGDGATARVASRGIDAIELTCFPFSQEHYTLIYGTAPFALLCVLTDVYNNMGTWRLRRPIQRPTGARGILAQAVRRLMYLVGPAGTYYDPNDEEEWDWLSLIYAMTGCLVIIPAAVMYLHQLPDDVRAALEWCRRDPNITVNCVWDANGVRVESVTFRPNTGLPVLDRIYGDLPVTRELLEAAGVLDMAAFARDLQALNDPANDIPGNPGSAHRMRIRREAGVNDRMDEGDI